MMIEYQDGREGRDGSFTMLFQEVLRIMGFFSSSVIYSSLLSLGGGTCMSFLSAGI